jgi:uncharacterized cupin superfamily protein
MSERRHPNVVHIDDVTPREPSRGKLGFRGRRLGPEAGGRALGVTYIELAPGKTAFPNHWHSAIEEGIYVLEGTGTMRIADKTVPVHPGDYIALPPGPATTHQLTNTGAVAMRYLALSAPAAATTMDVVVYPDSNKVSYATGVDPVKGFAGGTWILGIHKQQPPVDYYLDEPLAQE